MYASPLLFLPPAVAACPLPPADVPPPLRPGQLALAPDGAAHLLLTDEHVVCWWSVSEEGDRRVNGVWPLPGPHPVAIAVAPGGDVVLAGRTAAGWAVSIVGEGAPSRDVILGGDGRLVELDVDDGYAELVWVGRDGRAWRGRVGIAASVLGETTATVREPSRDAR